MALKSANGIPGDVEITTIGVENTANAIPNSSKWTIEYNIDGYVFYYVGTSSMAMRCSGPFPTADVVTEIYSTDNVGFRWTLDPVEQMISGAYLWDTYNTCIVSENVTKYVIYNTSTQLIDLNLKAFAYSTESISQSFSWRIEDPTVATINSTTGTIIGKKTGSTTIIGTPQNDASQTVSFEIVVVGPEQYSAGVRVTTIDGIQYYDYTIAVNKLFDEAVELCEDHRCINWEQYCAWVYDTNPFLTPSLSEHSSMQLGSFLWFYQHVNGEKVWDIKLENRWEDAMPNVPYLGMHNDFVFRGEKRTAEDLGNIMYGYTGRSMGFGTITLYWGGGVANRGSVTHEELTHPPLYGDEPNDHEMITYGFYLFNSDYPEYPEVGYDGIPLDGWIAEIADVILNPKT